MEDGTVITRSMNAPPVRLQALSLGGVAVAGSACLALPFWGDQALFTLYARELAQGAVLYRDVFDARQPGIFLFYLAGGSLFGFTEVGIHLFELVWWLAFSVFVFVALPAYFRTRWGAALVPLSTVAVYYCYAGLLDLGQIEIVVAFPLLVAWWLIDRARSEQPLGVKQFAAAGAAAAVVGMLSYLYLLVVFAFVGYAWVRARRRRIPSADLQRGLAAFLAVLVIPFLASLAYFAFHGQLGRTWWAYFEMAPAAHLTSWRNSHYLAYGARRFLIGHAPILILAAAACARIFRHRKGRQFDLASGMILWGLAGIVAVLVLQGWPIYKWAFFTVPLGILAVAGLEAVVDVLRRYRKRCRPGLALGLALGIAGVAAGWRAPEIQTLLLVSILVGSCAAIASEVAAARPSRLRPVLYVFWCALAISIGLAAIAPIRKVSVLMKHDFVLTPESRAGFQHALNHAYDAADHDLNILRSGDALPGPIHVFGDPAILLRANRLQAVPIPGWAPERLDSRAWRQLYDDLRTTPPSYVMVDGWLERYIRRHCPAILEWLESEYRVAFVGFSGTWYEIKRISRDI